MHAFLSFLTRVDPPSTRVRSPITSLIEDYLRNPWAVVQAVVHDVGQWVHAWGFVAGPTAALAAVASGLLRVWWRRRNQIRLHTGARRVTVLPPPTVDPAGAIALWSNLVGLLRPAWRRWLHGQPHLAWEYVFSHERVSIHLWVPGAVPEGMLERAIEAAWPGAHTQTSRAAAPLPAGALAGQYLESAGGELRLARSEALPIKTDHPADPIRALFGAPVGLATHYRAVVQVLARPVTGARVSKARRAARRVRTGQSANIVGWLLDLLTPHSSPRHTRASAPVDHQTSLENSTQDRAIVTKQRGAQYETKIRYALTALVPEDLSHEDQAQVRQQLRGRAHAIASAFATFTEHNYYRRKKLRRAVRTITGYRFTRGDLLSVPELAALAHLPTDAAIPGLQRAGAQAVAPPPEVASAGRDIKPLGRSDSGHSRPVGLRVQDARHHLHILGATGSGKSELMARMILADAEAGRGLVVIDPKGDLVSDILMRLPEHLGPKVVLFDSNSRCRPPVLNPLEGADTARTVDNLVSIFSRVYAASWGPRTDDILRAGLLTLRARPDIPNVAELPKLLSNAAFRQRAVDQLDDDVLTDFWAWYDELSPAARAHVVAPLMNKLRGFLLRPFVRDALTGRSTVDMDKVLDGGICLVRIAKDSLGVDTARLVGSIVVARAWQAATRRARTPQSRRRDAGMFLDEAHHFLHLPYTLEDMLAEARGYRLSMTLAHQYLGQLPKDLEEGISTNARSKIFFTASPEDAKRLARHTQPRLSDYDLSHLGAFHAAVRLVAHGEEAQPFTVVTEKLPPAIPGRAKAIRKAAEINKLPLTGNTAPTQGRPHPTVDPRRTT